MKKLAGKPLVSVILPVYNSADYLKGSLHAIKKSSFKDYELIVVDDNSKDGSAEFAKKQADLVIRKKVTEGPGKARNKGAYASKGSILFFTDADIKIRPDTISRVVNIMEDRPEVGAIFGSYDDKPSAKNFFSQYKNLFHHYTHQKSSIKASTFWTGCGAVRRDIFLKLKGFSPKYSFALEDVDFGYRMAEKGINIMLNKELKVKHMKRWSFFGVVKSDIRDRAIPWIKIARKRGLPKDLNFKLSDRISGVVSCLFFACFIFMWFWSPLVKLTVLLAGVLLLLNLDVYRFFLKRKGLVFSFFAMLFHWFYFFYSSATYVVCSLTLKFQGSKK